MSNPFRAFWMRPQLVVSAILAAAATLVLPFDSIWARLLCGWCLGVTVYTGLVVWRVRRSRDALKQEASRLDDSAPVITLFALVAAAVSFGAVAMIVFGGQEGEADKAAHVALAALTMICAWVFVQTVFAIHYAHVYYGEDGGRSRGGLDFNGDDEPDFWDFVYFSITIGATAQTSDTDVTSKPMRRIVAVQSAYAYFFNTSVLALAINMAAAFVQR